MKIPHRIIGKRKYDVPKGVHLPWNTDDALNNLKSRLEDLAQQLEFNHTKLGIETAANIRNILNEGVPPLQKAIHDDIIDAVAEEYRSNLE